jgi:hypothetical protein
MLSRFISKQIPYRMICDGILNMDEKVLSMDDIQAISSFTPQDQDVKKKSSLPSYPSNFRLNYWPPIFQKMVQRFPLIWVNLRSTQLPL